MADDASWTDLEEVRPDLVEAAPIRHGMVLAGRYAVEKIIGRGGSGVVVRAHDRDLRQEVAIKIVRVELAGQRVWAGRLAREVKLARQIHHPHVCRVFDFEQAEGRAFLVMELAENGTLRDELRSGALAARPLAARIADARAVASALAAIHAAGIVHRDLTPQNLLRMADGRVVVSDFGLATDASESTSVHGGTVAYMAPEVLRGGKSSFASDIWALGVVMHELVFGVKPRWSDAASPEMLAPELGRKLTEEDRAVLDACRACTAKAPARRIARADEAGRLLTERRRWWSRSRTGLRRPLSWVAALTFAGAVSAYVVRTGDRPLAVSRPVQPAEAQLVVPTGEAVDWTDVSTVVAEVPERILCTRLLPDQHTIRFVWGASPHAEDLDIHTRTRTPSPLVPAAYAEGCPDVSPDGKRLVYQGHASDGRPFAFVSPQPDGSNAVAVVGTAEPSLSSEPTWLVDGQAFSYDIDIRRIGVFLPHLGETVTLPEPTSQAFTTSFRFATGGLLVVDSYLDVNVTELIGLSWPSLNEQMRFRVEDLLLDVHVIDRWVLFTSRGRFGRLELIAMDRASAASRRLGRIEHQTMRYPLLVPGFLAFASLADSADVYIKEGPAFSRITSTGDVFEARHCGPDLIIRREKQAGPVIERIDRAGRNVPSVAAAIGASPDCSPDGRAIFYSEMSSWKAKRCDANGCRLLTERPAISLAVSPDGERVAVLSFERRGIVVWVISAEGGETHDIAQPEAACAMGWASRDTLWIARKRHGRVVWTEVNASSGLETGKTVLGTHDCADGRPDPASPVVSDLRIVRDERSQLRLLREDRMGLR